MSIQTAGSNWSHHAFAEKVVVQPVARLRPLGRQTRRHSRSQTAKLCASLRQFGWVNPILVDDDLRVIAGLGRLAAARELGWTDAPCLIVSHLTEPEKRAYALADNQLSDLSEWDDEVLAIEFAELAGMASDFDLSVTGFDLAAIEAMAGGGEVEVSVAPPKPEAPVSRLGDVWCCDEHLVGCFDATKPSSVAELTPDELFSACVTDAPYNLNIQGVVTSRSAHREFVMGSGEMTSAQFTEFLTLSYGAAAERLRPGGLLYAAMDWRHMRNVLDAVDQIGLELIQKCVWCKPNAGQGGFYRSQYEEFHVCQKPGGPLNNRIQSGKYKRSRSNVWNYPGVTGGDRATRAAHAEHPSPKPVQMIIDILKDCTERGEVVFDPFGGGGSLLIAAEQCGRRARLLDLDPGYVDVMIKRWSRLTGKAPVLRASGCVFDDVAAQRAAEPPTPRIRVRTRAHVSVEG